MRKSNLVKAFMLGLCMSALTSGVAFAQASVGGTVPADVGEVQSDELNELYAIQKDIDQYVFVDHIREIEEKGFMINYTSVSDTFVEIGITPYTDENAIYLYELFGKENIKVVKFDESVIYATSVGVTDPAITDDVVVDDQPNKEDIYTTLETTIDETAANTDGVDSNLDDKVYKDDVNIQIDSTPEEASGEVNPEVIYYTAVADSAQDGKEVQLVSAADDLGAVKRGADEDSNRVSAPIMILAIAGGAALVGGAIIVSNKKKVVK